VPARRRHGIADERDEQPDCGSGELKIIAAILERPVIERIERSRGGAARRISRMLPT
jgi:hypothetical protein